MWEIIKLNVPLDFRQKIFYVGYISLLHFCHSQTFLHYEEV